MAKHAEPAKVRPQLLGIEYNTERPHMIIPEYGRHVQKMAQHLLTIKDKKERTRATEVVIQTMTQIHPYAKDGEELRRKLWDHLYIITNYELDVESPYPKLEKGIFESKPQRLQYPATSVKYMHYGKIIPEMIKKAVKLKEGEERDVLVEAIAMLMKKAYMTWNKSTVSDNIIIKDLGEMSQAKLELKDVSKLNSVFVSLLPPQKPSNFGRNNNNKRNKNKDRNRRRDKKGRNGGF
jgi:hypothetical protein